MSETNKVEINTKVIKDSGDKNKESLNDRSEKLLEKSDTKTIKEKQYEEKIKNINSLLDQYDEIEWLTGC